MARANDRGGGGGYPSSATHSVYQQGPEIPTTGTLPGHCSEIWENMEKWGEMVENVSFLVN